MRPLAGLLAALLLAGCETIGFYSQAVSGQVGLLLARQPVADLVADPGTDAALRERLGLVQALRGFAATELGLPVAERYGSFVDLNRRYVVWNVVAAPELSLAPRRWCYPVAGCASYRGYFSEERARRYADRLAAEGWDVAVGGVEAYSTLGWFNDPVLSSFLWRPEPDLAYLLFHELAHSVLHIPGDTTFNESFATTVGEVGVARWLDHGEDAEAWPTWQARQQRHRKFVVLVQAGRAELAAVYAGGGTVEERRAGKAAALDRLRQRWQEWVAQDPGAGAYGGFFDAGLNNARINSVVAYHKLVPAFDQLLQCLDNDLPAFLTAAKALAAEPPAARSQGLAALAAGQCQPPP